jgi:arylsulfatase A-like enzyme
MWRTLVCATFLLAGCATAPAANKSRPHVILISLDTVSAEHMDLYGYGLETMPFLTRFANENVTFENALSQAAYTLPSHYSMFTGVSPQSHRVEIDDYRKLTASRALDPRYRTLTQYLKQVGYRTRWSGTLHDEFLKLSAGLDRGFDELQKPWLDRYDEMPSVEERKQAFRDFFQPAKTGPAFFFMHTYSAHDPYTPDREFLARHSQGFPAKRLESAEDVIRLLAEGRRNKNKPQARERWLAQFNLSSKRDVDKLRLLYDAGLRRLDRKLEVLFAVMKEEGLLENSIVIVTSDHGEAFGEHGELMHSTPYRDQLHVPLIVKFPGAGPRRVSETVFGVDLLPTVLEALGLSPPTELDGRSLLAAILGREKPDPRPAQFVSGYLSDGVVERRWQLVRRANGARELFDLEADARGFRASDDSAQALRLETALEAGSK